MVDERPARAAAWALAASMAAGLKGSGMGGGGSGAGRLMLGGLKSALNGLLLSAVVNSGRSPQPIRSDGASTKVIRWSGAHKRRLPLTFPGVRATLVVARV